MSTIVINVENIIKNFENSELFIQYFILYLKYENLKRVNKQGVVLVGDKRQYLHSSNDSLISIKGSFGTFELQA